MKKLMIAAAAAAMIGGAYADLAYDYTASLKTTDGKKSGKVTNSFDLGWDGVDTFWYMDEDVVTLILADTKGEYFTTKTVGGNSGVPCLTSKAKKDAVWLVGTLKIATLAVKYPFQSDGKWCEQVSYQTYRCYRAAKSLKQKAVVYADSCCYEDFVGAFSNKENLDEDCVISFGLNHRFGGAELKKATKVEVFGYVNGQPDEGTPGFTVAGQGTWKDKLFNSVAGISSISGNIVGVLDAPTCQYCCDNPEAAYAWECDADDDLDLDSNLLTAAYGTWTLKFNKGKSN